MNIKWRSVNLMRTAKIGYIVMSIIFIIVGLLFVIHPVDSLMVIEKILGVSMLLFGVIKIIGYFSKDLFRLAFQYVLEFGIILMVLGLVMLIKPVQSLKTLFSISVTPYGIVMSVRLLQPEKAPLPILVTPSGIMMSVRLLQP